MMRRYIYLMGVMVVMSAAAYLYMQNTLHDLSAIKRMVNLNTNKIREMQPADEKEQGVMSLLKTLTEQCERHKLDLFVLGPDLLSAMANNQLTGLLDVWNRSSSANSSVLTFGVIEPDMGNLGLGDFYAQVIGTGDLLQCLVMEGGSSCSNRMAGALDGRTFLRHHVVTGVDLRGVTMDTFLKKKTLHSVPFHYVWWSRGSAAPTPLIHVVIFRLRSGHLWQGQLLPPKAEALPFSVSDLVVGQDARMVDRFIPQTSIVHGISLRFPSNITAFLRAYRDGLFLECDYRTAMTLAKGGKKVRRMIRSSQKFNRKVLGILASTKKTLDKVGIKFWIANGILLGWYRQCGIIGYAGDLDIQLSMRDYSQRVVSAMVKSGHQIRKRVQGSNKLHIKFRRGEINMDMLFVSEAGEWFGQHHNASLQNNRIKYQKFSLSQADLLGFIVHVPVLPELYIRATYGPEWRTPGNFPWTHRYV